jgi:hypothetical protein
LNAAPLSIRLRPSPVLAFALITGHLLGLLALAVSLDGLALMLAAAGVMLSTIRTAGDAFQWWADSPLELDLHEGGRAAWRDRLGHWHETSIASGGYVSPWLIIVPLGGSGWRRKWIVIPTDAASRDDRRRLRVWLRWRPGKNTPVSE